MTVTITATQRRELAEALGPDPRASAGEMLAKARRLGRLARQARA